MKMTQVPIAQASDDQLRNFAETMQLEVSSVADRSELLSTIRAAWSAEHIVVPGFEESEVQGEQRQAVEPPLQRLSGGMGKNDPKVLLKISKTMLPGGKDPVPVAHNGATVVIQRDLLAEVPYRFFLALQDAIREDVTQDPNTGAITTDEVTNYPLQVFARPTAEEIAAWEERTANEFCPA